MHNFLSWTSANLLQCSITLLHITTCTRKIPKHSHPSTSIQNRRCDKSGIEKGKHMRVQEGALHIWILPSTVSLSYFRKPTVVFDSPTCYSVQEKDSKATPPLHLNAPPLRTTNGVYNHWPEETEDHARARDSRPNQTSIQIFLSRTSTNLLQCSSTLHITACTRKMQEHSHPSIYQRPE